MKELDYKIDAGYSGNESNMPLPCLRIEYEDRVQKFFLTWLEVEQLYDDFLALEQDRLNRKKVLPDIG